MTLNYEGAWEGFGGKAEGSIAHLSCMDFSCLLVVARVWWSRFPRGFVDMEVE